MRSLACILTIIFGYGINVHAQTYSNPYAVVENWASLPEGRNFGAVGDVDIAPDGEHIWVIIRCDATERKQFGAECLDSNLDPISVVSGHSEKVH